MREKVVPRPAYPLTLNISLMIFVPAVSGEPGLRENRLLRVRPDRPKRRAACST
jgi:hypothetical protein